MSEALLLSVAATEKTSWLAERDGEKSLTVFDASMVIGVPGRVVIDGQLEIETDREDDAAYGW